MYDVQKRGVHIIHKYQKSKYFIHWYTEVKGGGGGKFSK